MQSRPLSLASARTHHRPPQRQKMWGSSSSSHITATGQLHPTTPQLHDSERRKALSKALSTEHRQTSQTPRYPAELRPDLHPHCQRPCPRFLRFLLFLRLLYEPRGGPPPQHSSQDVARNVAVQRQRHLCVESPSPTITGCQLTPPSDRLERGRVAHIHEVLHPAAPGGCPPSGSRYGRP